MRGLDPGHNTPRSCINSVRIWREGSDLPVKFLRKTAIGYNLTVPLAAFTSVDLIVQVIWFNN